MEDRILLLQEKLITKLRAVKYKRGVSSFEHSVYFDPECARFMYEDQYVLYEIVEPLIRKGIIKLKSKSFVNHQGVFMLSYGLHE